MLLLYKCDRVLTQKIFVIQTKDSGSNPDDRSKLKGFKMSIPSRYFVNTVESKLAQNVSMENHYLHRKAPCMQAFGLFDRQKDDTMVGILMFGVSASSTLLKGVCGPDEASNVIELTRLWIEDGTPKNTESYFIGQCLRHCCREIIVSFADTSAGHKGTVYQATNWIYTGLSAKFKDPKHKGEFKDKHHTGWARDMSNQQIRDKWGDLVEFVERARKHRYIYINAKSKKRKKQILNKLRYKKLAYPA